MASPAGFKKNARAGRTYLSPSREGARLHISYQSRASNPPSQITPSGKFLSLKVRQRTPSPAQPTGQKFASC